MGTLHYGAPAASFPLEDRTLAHFELVIMAKLRRREGLVLVLAEDAGRRQSMWVSPDAAVRFEYEAAMPEINRRWLQDLVDAANPPGGLRLLPEPEPESGASR